MFMNLFLGYFCDVIYRPPFFTFSSLQILRTSPVSQVNNITRNSSLTHYKRTEIEALYCHVEIHNVFYMFFNKRDYCGVCMHNSHISINRLSKHIKKKKIKG